MEARSVAVGERVPTRSCHPSMVQIACLKEAPRAQAENRTEVTGRAHRYGRYSRPNSGCFCGHPQVLRGALPLK